MAGNVVIPAGEANSTPLNLLAGFHEQIWGREKGSQEGKRRGTEGMGEDTPTKKMNVCSRP